MILVMFTNKNGEKCFRSIFDYKISAYAYVYGANGRRQYYCSMNYVTKSYY